MLFPCTTFLTEISETGVSFLRPHQARIFSVGFVCLNEDLLSIRPHEARALRGRCLLGSLGEEECLGAGGTLHQRQRIRLGTPAYYHRLEVPSPSAHLPRRLSLPPTHRILARGSRWSKVKLIMLPRRQRARGSLVQYATRRWWGHSKNS